MKAKQQKWPRGAPVFDLNTPFPLKDGSLTYEGMGIVFNYGQWCIDCRRLTDGKGPGAMPLDSVIPLTPTAAAMLAIAKAANR